MTSLGGGRGVRSRLTCCSVRQRLMERSEGHVWHAAVSDSDSQRTCALGGARKKSKVRFICNWQSIRGFRLMLIWNQDICKNMFFILSWRSNQMLNLCHHHHCYLSPLFHRWHSSHRTYLVTGVTLTPLCYLVILSSCHLVIFLSCHHVILSYHHCSFNIFEAMLFQTSFSQSLRSTFRPINYLHSAFDCIYLDADPCHAWLMAILGSSWDHLWTIWGHFVFVLGPCWVHLGPY